MSPAPSRIRVLSIDGGGIYGLASAIWLRRLCERQPRFLSAKDVSLFAGTSSGAINSLLLARHEEPRKALLAGDLERFWSDPRPFQNNDPMLSAASLFGVAGWFSGKDFLAHLHDTFGDLRLGDLPQEVLISAFNWRGSEKEPLTRAGQTTRHWQPKFLSNSLRDDPDNDLKVADVAYAAAAPPNLRPIYGGLGDGASFSASPVVEAVAALVRHASLVSKDGTTELRILRDRDAVRRGAETFNVGAVLDRVVVLSVGSGQRLPYLGATGEVNAGTQFSQMMTNLAEGDFWPTAAYSLDASTQAAEQVVKYLLGVDRAMRLNPGVLRVPTVMAAIMARFPLWWQWLLTNIREGAGGEPSTGAIDATLEFLRAPQSWDIDDALGNQAWSPQRENPRIQLANRPGLAARGATLVAVYPHAETGELLAACSQDGGQSFDQPRPVDSRSGEAAEGDEKGTRPPEADDGSHGPVAPAVAVFGGSFWAAARVAGRLRVWTSPDGQTWTFTEELPESGVGAPALASNGTSLVLVYRVDRDVYIRQLTSNKGTFSAASLLDFKVGACPSLAASAGGFVMAWRGPEERTIWTARSRDGLKWTEAAELSTFTILEESPALTYSESTRIWYMAWRREEWPPNIWVSSSENGFNWTPPFKLHDRATRHAPCLAAVGDVVCMGWHGTGEDSLWTSRLIARGGGEMQRKAQVAASAAEFPGAPHE